MVELTILVLLLCSVACLFRADFLIPVTLVVGYLQDPLRKLVPGEPVYFVVFVGLGFAFAFLGLFIRNGYSIFEVLSRWSPRMRVPLAMFLCLLAAQTVNSLLSYANPILTGIGLMSYTVPLIAMIAGYFAFDSEARAGQLLRWYALGGVVVSIGVIISFLGYDWSVLREVGSGLVIYDQGTAMRAYSGFMRSSEVAAWHMATALCFLIILNVASRNKARLPISALIGLLLFLAIVLTGRRKMIVQVVQFCAIYSVLFYYFRRSLSPSILILAFLLIATLWVGIELIFPGGYGETFGLYVARGVSVFGDAWDRMYNLGLMPITWAYNRTGLLGGGVGIGSQGTQYFGGGAAVFGGASEGGLGKIMLELGILGLIILPWLAYATAAFFVRAVKFSQLYNPQGTVTVIGIFSFIIANIPTFVIATQIYGDMFVLSMLGLLAGYMLSLPKLTLMSNPAIEAGANVAPVR